MKRHSGVIVNKSRYGRKLPPKKYNDEFDIAFKESISKIDNSLPHSTTLTKSSSSSSVLNNTSVRNCTNKKTSDFSVGDLVWAKMGKYPIWPGIVISHPKLNMIYTNENNSSMLHVYFFNDSYKRNWVKINQIFKFTSKNKVLTDIPKTLILISKSAIRAKWNRAVDEAECLAAMSRDNRISAFFANNYLPDIPMPLLNASQIDNSKRKTPKNNTDTIATKADAPTFSLQTRFPKRGKANNITTNNYTKTNISTNSFKIGSAKKEIPKNNTYSVTTKADASTNSLQTRFSRRGKTNNIFTDTKTNASSISPLVVVSPKINGKNVKSSVLKANSVQTENLKNNKPQDPITRPNKKRKLNEAFESQQNDKKTTLPNGYIETHNLKRQKLIPSNFPKDHPRTLIPKLCRQFFKKGWATGTGGGISIKYNGQIFIAPSGVQKELLEPEDIFVQSMTGVDIEVPPVEKNFSKSQCTPIFMCSYIERNAGAVIHIHSMTLQKLCYFTPENELCLNDAEPIKGIYNEEKQKYYDNDEDVIIPIIPNTKYERDLVDSYKIALTNYPMASAVAVRNHGLYVWGKDWESAKKQCECYEYLFEWMLFKKMHN